MFTKLFLSRVTDRRADGFEASHPRTGSGIFGCELAPTTASWELAIAIFKHELVPRVGQPRSSKHVDVVACAAGRTDGRTNGRTDM